MADGFLFTFHIQYSEFSTISTCSELALNCVSPRDAFGPHIFDTRSRSNAGESWEEEGESSGTESEPASDTQDDDENEDEANLECTPPLTVGGKWYGNRMIVSAHYRCRILVTSLSG